MAKRQKQVEKNRMDYMPISKSDLEARGIEQLDFIIVTGDAYVDHPSFGMALIGRLLEAEGYSVGVISQPDWKHKESVTILGKPKLGFLVSSGNIDSMVNHYTVSKKRRHKDVYTPGSEGFKRPDRATIVYSNLIRQVYKDVDILIGGIEASLRRMAHYDYWSDSVRRSILMDSGADLLIYGMAETTMIEVAEAMNSGLRAKDLTYVRGTVHRAKNYEHIVEPVLLPTYKEVISDKKAYGTSFKKQYENTDAITGTCLVEPYDEHNYIIQNPPAMPLDQRGFDHLYELPYTYDYHPDYDEKGGVEAIKEIKFSLTSNRGCFGGCHFCALAFHQGRVVQARSRQSIVAEAKALTKQPDFKGYIHDVGGPTADFRKRACKKQEKHGVCTHKACMTPNLCEQLEVDHTDYLKLLRELRGLDGVKKVFVRSGIRYDYVVANSDKAFMRELTEHHVSGQLRVAPEHVSNNVLEMMGKPNIEVFNQFKRQFEQMNKRLGMDQYLVPYFISSHPGSDIKDAIALAEYIRDLGFMPEQVQDFYPTPGTISTCMYYTGIHPMTGAKVFVPKSPHDKSLQRALMQYKLPKNYRLVREALILGGREDLIGYDKRCLIKPEQHKKEQSQFKKGKKYNGSKGGNVHGKNKQGQKPRKKKTIRNVHKKKK